MLGERCGVAGAAATKNEQPSTGARHLDEPAAPAAPRPSALGTIMIILSFLIGLGVVVHLGAVLWRMYNERGRPAGPT